MPEVIYPIERLAEAVCLQTVSLTKALGEGLDQVAAENPDMPGIDDLLATVDADPAPLFGLSMYVQLRALANAKFPDDAIALVQARASDLLEGSLGKPEFHVELTRWTNALSVGWDKVIQGDAADGWIQHIVSAFEAHYGEGTDHQGTVWARLFYLTLIADTYRQNATTVAEQLKQSILTEQAVSAGT
ncbi:MAG: hypothetical protein H7338_20025 [Candidatus Sericytochromatia bacterium]|nr:hypothetical protein [Candidatus Sericytochromatia bacterium]